MFKLQMHSLISYSVVQVNFELTYGWIVFIGL